MPRRKESTKLPDQLLTDDVIYPYWTCFFQGGTFSYGDFTDLKWEYRDVRSLDVSHSINDGSPVDSNSDKAQKTTMKLLRLVAVDEAGAVCHNYVERGRSEPLQPLEWAQILTEGGKNAFPRYPEWLPDSIYEHFHKAVENAWRPIKATVTARWQAVYGQQVMDEQTLSQSTQPTIATEHPLEDGAWESAFRLTITGFNLDPRLEYARTDHQDPHSQFTQLGDVSNQPTSQNAESSLITQEPLLLMDDLSGTVGSTEELSDIFDVQYSGPSDPGAHVTERGPTDKVDLGPGSWIYYIPKAGNT